ncbi:MAG: ATP synthase F1 subunit delta [Saprospiraceae bacterium]|nr:ATP synthase F1 subunit delta [Saprospiraceae bacterium]
MSVSRIASRYAQSLLDITREASDTTLEQIHDDMSYVWEVSKLKDFDVFIKNPLISTDKKISTLEALFPESKVSSYVLKTLVVIAEHRREAYLQDICRMFHVLYNKEKQISTVKLTTATEISEAMAQDILNEFRAKKFGGKPLITANVELELAVDPSIVGGFIVQFNDKVYDSSLARKLEGLKTKFSKNLYIKNI